MRKVHREVSRALDREGIEHRIEPHERHYKVVIGRKRIAVSGSPRDVDATVRNTVRQCLRAWGERRA